MPTRTQPGKRPAATTGRFSRSATTSAQRAGRARAAQPRDRRTLAVPRRRPQKKTGMAKVMDGIGGALGGGKAAKKGGGSAKGRTAGGLAMLAGAAGLAMKNRGRIQEMLGRKGSGTGDRTAHADAPAHPVVVDERGPNASTAGTGPATASPPMPQPPATSPDAPLGPEGTIDPDRPR